MTGMGGQYHRNIHINEEWDLLKVLAKKNFKK